MHQGRKSFWAILAALLSLAGINFALVYFASPGNLFVEAVEIIAMTAFLLISISWAIGKLKWGAIITGAIISALILRRVELLNWITLGIGMVIFGLISLI